MGVFKETVVKGEEIFAYIPQRPPIVLVDEFLGVEGATSASKLTVVSNSIFCEEEHFSECGVIEHVAQSAALRIGYLFKNEGKEIPLGFVGAVSKCCLYKLPRVGDTLYTEITLEQELFNISLISAVVKIDEEMIATCQMKIYLQQ